MTSEANSSRPSFDGKIERLDAHAVPAKKNVAGSAIEDGKGEHAAEPRRAGRPPFFVGVDDDLGVAVGLERVAAGLKLGLDLHEVVNLAVVDNHHGCRPR